MRLLKTLPHLTDDELLEKLNSQDSVITFRCWQIIYSVQINYGKNAEEFAKIFNVKKSKIYSIIQTYNKKGKNWKPYEEWGGRREERCNLSLEQEAAILKEVSENALAGRVLIYKHIKSKVEEKVGRVVSDDYIWDLFKRHNWKKKVPRPSHPKSNKKEQEEYKKNSKRYWQPNQ